MLLVLFHEHVVTCSPGKSLSSENNIDLWPKILSLVAKVADKDEKQNLGLPNDK